MFTNNQNNNINNECQSDQSLDTLGQGEIKNNYTQNNGSNNKENGVVDNSVKSHNDFLNNLTATEVARRSTLSLNERLRATSAKRSTQTYNALNPNILSQIRPFPKNSSFMKRLQNCSNKFQFSTKNNNATQNHNSSNSDDTINKTSNYMNILKKYKLNRKKIKIKFNFRNKV
jgi:hypothetical protein